MKDPLVRSSLALALASAVLAAPAAAQGFGNAWLEFSPAPTQPPAFVGLSSSTMEVDFTVGDLDQDGAEDIVVVRQQAFTMPGKRTNVLLMNEHGALVDRSAALASASTVVGDQGFLTPTQDRDAALVDVDGDGWIDVVTAAQLSQGNAKHVSHPRVYRNLGEGAGGEWLGLRFENERFPQLFSLVTGSPLAPNFNAVAAGDVDGDGFAELYFADHDAEPASEDTNDRLLVNDGNGFFVDLSSSLTFLTSSFSNAAAIVDLNGDGANDVLKHTHVQPPQHIAAVYNDPTIPGTFDVYQTFHNFAPSSVTAGELNNDGRIDVVIPDDGADRFRLNTGNDALGRVIWGSATAFSFLAGADDGFAGRPRIVDLDDDGWNDALIASVDFLVPSNSGRLRIYHNRGTVPGSTPVLMEERESASPTGWIGAVGLGEANLARTYDTAVLDVDGDGDKDLVIGRRDATTLWLNDANVCQDDLGGASPGGAELALCGPELVTGATATLTLGGATPTAPFFLALGAGQGALPLFGGTLVPLPLVTTLLFVADANGNFSAPVAGFGPAPDLFLQALVLHGASLDPRLTNALRVELP